MKDPKIVKSHDEDYPGGLFDLETQPKLWVIGQLPQFHGVAVVGTRRCTRYGIDLAESFGKAIARSGWSTVSGLARGIDTAAHRGCLRLQGHGAAILGSGIDVCYPKENLGLYERIVDLSGCIISEYGPGTPPDRWRFPARNRLIAAMASAVVVVEAGVTGGALITARLAAEIGRPVFAVPGDVDRPASEGCNRLIRDGAFPVFGATDLIEELSLILGPPTTKTNHDAGIPEGGVEISELPELWGLTVSETLIKLGKLETDDLVRRSGDTIVPT